MKKTSYHVIPSLDGGWSVRKTDTVRASRHFKTRQAAIAWASKIVAAQKSSLVIHKADGTVLRKETFSPEAVVPQKIAE